MKNLAGALLFVLLVTAPGTLPAQAGSLSEAVETTADGFINWTTGEVSASGIGAPPAQPANAAQARAMAERAAVVVAYRNLLEIVKGVQVDAETVVENLMTRSDVVRTRVSGIVNGARVVKTRYLSDGSVEVQVVMPLRGAFLNAVVPDDFGGPLPAMPPTRPSPLPQRPPDSKPVPPVTPPTQPTPPAAPEKKVEPIKPLPAPVPERKAEPVKPGPQPAPAPGEATVQFKGGVATGLVIDGRGLGLRPALLPKIVDPQGREIYVGQVVTRTNAVEQGVAGYAKDVGAAANNFRVTDNPAVMKGQQAVGNVRTDVMLGQADSRTLRELGTSGDFLQYCRVIIVY